VKPTPLGAVGVLLGALLVLAGCGGERDRASPAAEQPPVAQDPAPRPPAPAIDLAWLQGLLSFHQQAPTVTVDLLIRAKAPDGDAILFQLNLWCPADGRVRLKCSKLDVDFIDALVQPNGDFVLELVRSREVVRGNLRDVHVFDRQGKVSGPPFLAYLSLLVQEAKSGPVPDRGVARAGAGRIEAKDPATGLDVAVEVKPDDTVASKRFLDAPGKEAVRLDYARYKAFGRLQRPTQLQIAVPGDANEYTVRLRHLDAVPSIDPGRMRFTPSQGAKEIGLEEFLERLRE
jgi:hypothetical protein